MKKRIYTIVSLMILFIGSAMSQNVVLNAEIDTFQMMIGEQTRIRLELSVDTGYKVSMPELKNELMPGIEILEKKSERKSLNENRRNLFTDEYLITSFDSTLYDIPPFKVKVDSSEYLSNSNLTPEAKEFIVSECVKIVQNNEEFYESGIKERRNLIASEHHIIDKVTNELNEHFEVVDSFIALSSDTYSLTS